MNMLEQVTTGKRVAPRRIMVYGLAGIGKTTFASRADRSIFIPTEDGTNDIDCARFPRCETYAQFVDCLASLYTEPHDYRTAVVDSLDWLERLIWQDVCRLRRVETIEDIDYQKGYVFALAQWREVLTGLDALRSQRQMTIILLAHSKIEKFADPHTDTYDRYAPRLHRLASALVQEWCDEVLFATTKVYTRQTDEGFGRKKAKAIGDGERVLRTTARPAHEAKNRLALPDELPLDWREFAKFLPTAA
jgi:hypothetical protein